MPATPLGAADVLNYNTGQASDVSSTNVTLDANKGSGTTAGGTVLIVVHSGLALATPSGFTKDLQQGSDTFGYGTIFRKASSTGETSWSVSTVSGTTGLQWQVFEVQRLAGTLTGSSGGSPATSDTLLNRGTGGIARNDCFIIGGFGLKTDTSQGSMSSMTLTRPTGVGSGDPWQRTDELRWATQGSNNLAFLACHSFSYPDASVSWNVTVTNPPGGTGGWVTVIAAYEAADSSRPDPLDVCTGFEYGLTPNTAAPTTALRLVDLANGTWGTQYQTLGAAARNGSYGLRISQSAAAGRVGWSAGGRLPASQDDAVLGMNVRVNSGSGVVVVAEIAPASGTILQLVYNVTNTQFGLRWGAGSVSYEVGTTALGAWKWIEVSADGFTGTTRTARWATEVTGGLQDETAPADLTGQSASSLLSVSLGLNSSQTMQADYDDVCVSTHASDYHLGKHKVVLCGVDPADTVVVSGSTANFSTFASNSTLTAWNATTARDAVDEVPPTISASADGVVQTAVATSDYVAFPMASYTLGGGETISAVMAIFALWANSGQNATIDLRVDGSSVLLTTATSFNPGNAAQPASSTVPTWVCGKAVQAANWSQTLLNNTYLNMGLSSDAAPDIGIHACYLEVAVRLAATVMLFGETGAELRVETDADPLRGTPATLYCYTPAGYGATLRVTVGPDTTSTAIAAGSNPQTVTVAAADVPGLTRVELQPDA